MTDYLQLARERAAGAPPAEASNPYLPLALDAQKQQHDLARSMIERALADQPDLAAERQRLSQTSGLPLSVIERNLEEVRRKEAVRALDLIGMAQDSPVLARQLADPRFTSVAVDDISTLDQIEKTVGNATRYVLGAAEDGGLPGQLGRGIRAMPSASAGAVAGVKRAAADVIEPWARLVVGDDNWFAQMSKYYAGQAKGFSAQTQAILGTARGNLDAGVASGALSFATNLKYLPFALTGPAGAALALAGMAGESFGTSYNKAADKNLPLWQSLGYASADAMVEYWTEKIPLDRLIGGIRQGAPFLQTFAKQLGYEIPGEQLATVLQDLNEWATLNPGKPFSDYLRERPDAAVQTLIATVIGTGGNVMVTSSIGHVLDTIGGTQWRDNVVTSYADLLQQQLQLAGQSALRERSPEQFRSLVQQITQSNDGAPKSVYVDGEVLNQLAPEVLNQLPAAVQTQIAEAAVSGGVVEIPMADVLTVAPGTPLEEVLNQHARMDPFAMSLAESQAAGQKAQEFLQQEAQRVIEQAADQEALRQSQEMVKAEIKKQLADTGRFRDAVNEGYATWAAAFYTAYGSRLGMTPEQFYQRYPLRVLGAPVGQQTGVLNAGERSIVNNMTAAQIQAEIADLMPRVQQAYEAGNAPLAERLDARLETLMDALDANLSELEEDTLTPADLLNPMLAAQVKEGEQGDAEADVVRDLANRWRDMQSRQGDTLDEQAAELRAMLDDYAFRHGGLREGLTDAEVLDAARDAYDAVYGRLERLRERLRAQAGGVLNQAALATETEQDRTNSLGAARISPRLPTAKKATEDALGDTRLQPDLETAMRDPAVFAHNIGLMVQYPNFKGLQGTVEEQAEAIIQSSVDNLLWLHDHWKPEYRERSKLWYVGGNRIAHRWAERFGVAPEQVAAVIAATSPQKDWFQNVSLAERILEAVINNSESPWDAGMTELVRTRDWGPKAVPDPAVYEGKTLRDLYRDGSPEALLDMSIWIRAWDEANNPMKARVITPEGGFTDKFDAGKTGKEIGLRWQSFPTIVKTLQVLMNNDRAALSEIIGANHKVRSFFNNIIAPYAGDDVTIDTHAVAAALLRPLGSSSTEVFHNFGSGEPGSPGPKNSAITGLYGTYAIYAEAYRRAAKARGILPREMQSITWEAVRGLFRPEQKNEKIRAESDRIWSAVAAGELDANDARKQIEKLVGGIQDPAWVRSPAGTNEAPADSSYAGELPRAGGTQGTADGRGGMDAAGGIEPGGQVLNQEGLTDGRDQPAGDRAGRYASGSLTPLEGAPNVAGASGPDPRLVAVAEQYARDNGIPLRRQGEYAKVDPERAARIAAAYDAMVHAPQDPAVREAYENLIQQTLAQYRALEAAGYRFYLVDESNDPYGGNPWNAMRDLRANQVMGVFATEAGFGSGATELNVEDNPLLADTGLRWPYGSLDGEPKRVLANDLFRAVHDAFGHGLEGAGFRAQGEENAWQAHIRLFTGSARGAITSETRGQNSWLNFGPYGESNRNAKVEDTVFADQKTGLMPEWTWAEGIVEDMPEQPLQQGPRGTFNPQTLELVLNPNADLSTWFHETGHFFLEVLADVGSQPGAPAQIVEDYNKILAWFGVTPQQWAGFSLDQKRPYHERWAESIEQYILEGKAPSVELLPVMRRFSAWLKSVYRSIQQFLAGRPDAAQQPLNDDIRRVMDRMLATDEQIAQANEVAGFLPDEQADGEAAERLQKRSMADLKWAVKARDKVIAKLKREAREIEKQIREQVTAEIDASPEMQAKVAIEKAEKEFEADPMAADMNIAVIADAFGFASVDTMYQAIDAFGKRADAIDGLTEQRMLEQHGDLIDERSIQQAANEAVHNEARARSLATELRTQQEMMGQRRDTGETTARGARITVSVLVEAAKQFGANVIARTSLKDLRSTAWKHTAAERRAGKRWQEATAKGQTQDAVQAKRDQVLNNAAAKAALDAITESKKILEFFKRVTKGNDEKTVEKGRDPDIVNAARAVLAAYGVQTPASKGAAAYLEAVQRNDPDTYAALEPMIAAATANAQPLEALTFEELQGLNEAIQAFWFLAKRSRQMEVDGDLLDIDDVAGELFTRMEEIGIPDRVPGEGMAVTRAEERGLFLMQGLAFLRRVEAWAEGMDGKYGGPFLRYVFQPIKDAADRYRKDRIAYRKRFQALVDNLAPIVGDSVIEAPELGYTFGTPGSTAGTAMNEILHAIAHTGNDSNKRKLLLGRGWATENPDGTLDTSRWDAFIQRLVNENKLTQGHFDFVQGVWDLLEDTKPLAQKAHRDAFGRYFSEVTANEFVDPFGVTRRGGYLPAQVDTRLVKDNALRKMAEEQNNSMAYSFPQPAKGFTISRTEYNQPLMLDLRSLSQHIDKVLLFGHMTNPARDVRKLITRKTVSQPLDRIQPATIESMLQPWLQRSAQQIVETPIVGTGKWARVPGIIRARAGMALMFANVSNAIQQVTGLANAAVRVKPSFLMRSLAQYVSNPREFSRAVWAASPYMDDRAKNEVAVLNEQMQAILIKPTAYETVKDWSSRHAYFLQTALDNVLSPIVWNGAFNQGLAEGMSDADAVRFADSSVRQTQGSTLPEDVSRLETGPAYARAFTQFVGYFNMMANTNATALKQIVGEVGLKRGAGKALYVVLMGLMAPIWAAEAIALAFKGGPEDEDDDGYLDDWLASVFGMGTLKGMLAQIPIAGQFGVAAIQRFNDNPLDDRVSLSPAVSLLESAVGAPQSVYKAIVDEGSAQKAIRDVATLVSVATGVPLYGVARPIGYAAGVAQGKIEPEGPLDVARGLITGTASPESKQR